MSILAYSLQVYYFHKKIIKIYANIYIFLCGHFDHSEIERELILQFWILLNPPKYGLSLWEIVA